MGVSVGHAATLRTIDAIREAVLEELRFHSSVEIDCSKIEEADLSLLQLIEATRKLAARERKDVTLAPDISPAFAALVARAGFGGARHLMVGAKSQ